jgi:predicted DNA-binding WGR domain protein
MLAARRPAPAALFFVVPRGYRVARHQLIEIEELVTMRCFEHRGTGSAKFWWVSRDGAVVTVRFGRAGTAGQTRVKELADEAAAIAHVEGLASEKVAKGYVEVAAGAAAPVPGPVVSGPDVPAGGATEEPVVSRDEDVLVLPAQWMRKVQPRRGGRVGGSLPRLAGAVAKAGALMEAKRTERAEVLAAPRSDGELVAAAEGFLDGSRVTPLGAAAAVVASAHACEHREFGQLAVLADGWIAAHGLTFATRAVAEAAGLDVRRRGYSSPDKQENLRRVTPADRGGRWSFDPWLPLAERVRARLAVADDDGYEQARQALAGYRSTVQRTITTYLMPTESPWADEDCGADLYRIELVGFAVSTPEQWDRLAGKIDAADLSLRGGLLATLLDAVGPAVTPHLIGILNNRNAYTDQRRTVIGGLALIPTDEAFGALLLQADDKPAAAGLSEAMQRFPVRALRLLGTAAADPGGNRGPAAELLRRHVTANPEVAGAALPSLPELVRWQVEPILASLSTVPQTPAGSLHPLLVTPPWTRARAVAAPVVVTGLTAPDVPRLCWAPGEREALVPQFVEPGPEDAAGLERWEQEAAKLREGRMSHAADEEKFFVGAPRSLALELLPGWRPTSFWSPGWTLPRLLLRFGADAIPVVVRRNRERGSLDVYGPLLLPAEGAEVAALMADWLDRLKAVRWIAVSWLRRHPQAAARDLVPAAVGPVGAERRAAEQALRVLVAAGHADVVRAAAADHGTAAASAVEPLLSADAAEAVPARLPDLPPWIVDAGALTPVLSRDRRHALPPEAVRHLCTMLAMSRLGLPYPGLAAVRETLDPVALAEFGWSLFTAWESAGFPPKQSWVLEALALIGDDDTVRRLSPVVRAWPGAGGHARATIGLDVLYAIGSELALIHLHAISRKVRFEALKYGADSRVRAVAAELGLTSDQLADRLVPDFGLNDRNTLTLDYGPRRFVVTFDEQLKPLVMDEDGRRRKELPRPGANDDEALATAAYRRFSALKKDLRSVAADQVRRLEEAMVTRRRWTGAEFRRLLVGHPLMVHLARRLVWVTYRADGTVGTAFRVAEDGSLADVDDKAFTLADDDVAGVAHPVDLEADLSGWTALFLDYEILQPFPQLHRPVWRLTAEQAAQRTLPEFVGVAVPVDRLMKLERRGWWGRSVPMDAGIQTTMECDLPGPGGLDFPLDPGISVNDVYDQPGQIFRDVRLTGVENFAALDPVIVSELLCDLHYLVDGGSLR